MAWPAPSVHPGLLHHFFCNGSCRSGLIREWKREHGPEATYEELLKACVETNHAEAAECIVTLLNCKIFMVILKIRLMYRGTSNNRTVVASKFQLVSSCLHFYMQKLKLHQNLKSCQPNVTVFLLHRTRQYIPVL